MVSRLFREVVTLDRRGVRNDAAVRLIGMVASPVQAGEFDACDIAE